MIKFIADLKAKSSQHYQAADKKNLVDLLVKRMGKYYPERSHEVVHASDVTKSNFCPRYYRLMDTLGLKRKARYLSAALSATFDMGHDVAARICNDWLGDDAVGDWVCSTCNDTAVFQKRPGNGCAMYSPPRCNWKYKEVKFVHQESQISGSLDLMVSLGGSRVTLIELKIIKPEDFALLKAPMGEHRARTRLYLRLVEESTHPLKGWVEHTHAKILYVSRGYGKKNESSGQVLPFIEFDINADHASVQPYIDRGREVLWARQNNTIPTKKICESVSCSTAKGCEVRAQCFSGETP